jgi:hypothetical protein
MFYFLFFSRGIILSGEIGGSIPPMAAITGGMHKYTLIRQIQIIIIHFLKQLQESL